MRLAAVIPALDEAASLPLVLCEIPHGVRVVVVDNGSRDGTGEVARRAGAEVVVEPRRGYGRACLAGLAHLAADPPDVVVFLDADHSDYPEELTALVEPIKRGSADFVVGSRVLGGAAPGSLTPQQRFGNRLVCTLVDHLYGHRFTDLGPFRAVRYDVLSALEMRDPTFGWTIEMQIKAVRRGFRVVEVPVRYRKRIGTSKISGTLSGTLRAGTKIVFTVFRHAWGR
jgi:glycosyltransferase involved in cell wall biosynthesis